MEGKFLIACRDDECHDNLQKLLTNRNLIVKVKQKEEKVKMKRKILGMCVIMVLILVGTAFTQGKISGYMFGDYYYMAANHNEDLEGENGFWFRRIYFTYDQGLSDNFDVRFRIEMNTAGDFTTKSKLTPFVKDAYLKWKHDRHSIIFGISPTPTWEVIEKVWGYRSVEKTPLDLQKFGSSRDFGVALKGSLDQEKRVTYHFMIANGNGNSSETNAGKKILFSLSGKLNKHFIVQGYADFDERPGKKHHGYTLQGFAAYQQENFRLGVQFAHQSRQVGEGVDNLKLQIASVFAAAQLSPKTWGFVRFDRTLDPNPDGAKISYIPFDATAKSNFILAGVDIMPIKTVHFMPNLEVVVYSAVAGDSPDTDIIPRLTFYYVWK